jgi:hypothetical protein
MDNSNYPRADQLPSGPYPPDKTWGIVIVVLSSLGVCAGGCMLAGGGMLGAMGGAAAATTAGAGTTTNAMPSAAVAAGMGGLMMVLGVLTLILSGLQIFAGTQIMKSKRIGFLIAGGCAALNLLVSLGSVPRGLISTAISGVIIYYCVMRVTGKQGPPVIQ